MISFNLKKKAKQKFRLLPSHSLDDDQYKILLPYRPSAARGAITNQVANRVDIDELEEGLRRHSTYSIFTRINTCLKKVNIYRRIYL